MRSSNKRSRNKNNRRSNNGGNPINRVFDSSGPEGRVRGTPQQIIEKYNSLAGDAQLAGDRIAHESFLQFAEHYQRILSTAQREMEERKEAQQKAHAQRQQNSEKQAEPKAADSGSGEQPDLGNVSTDALFPAEGGPSDLVETPESKAATKPARKPRRPRTPKPDTASEPADPAA